ncbi:MAG TPA: hypoxanthine phosphoribosyltransferase [Candidatus Nitrosotalea sp.]|nr:hypoxanthine phosphoribosyltransferase [Candidatus Nitrosotalea sp.]
MTALSDQPGIGRVLASPAQIEQAIERLAAAIAVDYRRQPLLLLGVLKGALCFTADLARALSGKADGPSEIMLDYIFVERYGTLGSSGGAPRLTADASRPVAGANVLILDDIADNGRTLAFLKTLLEGRNPASLRTCALFDRPARREIEVKIDYVGMVLPDVFAIGYGLDYKEVYRNLPYVAELLEGKTV